MYDTLVKHNKDREKLDFYATDKRAIEELLFVTEDMELKRK